MQTRKNRHLHPLPIYVPVDNHTCNKEVIFSINFDGTNTKSYGGTTYIINAAIGGDLMPKAEFGTTGGWGKQNHQSTGQQV